MKQEDQEKLDSESRVRLLQTELTRMGVGEYCSSIVKARGAK
jgi:hypothetical protein